MTTTIGTMGRPSKESTQQRHVEGIALKAAMKAADVKQQEIADARGVEQNLVSQWVTGRTRIPDIDLLWLGKRLDFDVLKLRPSLLEYGQYFSRNHAFDGLSDDEIERVKAIISAFKQLHSTGNSKIDKAG